MCGTCQANTSITADKCAGSDSSPYVTFGPQRMGHTEKGVSKCCFRLHIQHVCYQNSYTTVFQWYSATFINGNSAENNTEENKDTVMSATWESEADETSPYFIYICLLLGGHTLWSITFAQKLWVVCASSSTYDFLSGIFVGENMSWQLSHPFTVRWVILCSSLGFGQSKPLPSSRQCRSKSRPAEKWRKNCCRIRSIPSLPVAGVLLMCSVIFCYFSLC